MKDHFHLSAEISAPGSRPAQIPSIIAKQNVLSAIPNSFGRFGRLEVRMARTNEEITAAQKLRYRIFYEEMSAIANDTENSSRLDADKYDGNCDHLLVLDHGQNSSVCPEETPIIVGTYRMLRQEVATKFNGFYSSCEFEVEKLVASQPKLNFLELGRSCVLKEFRTKRTIELLWRGIWSYVLAHNIDVMFGVASIETIDPEKINLPLSFLHHTALAPAKWRVCPVKGRRVVLDYLTYEKIEKRQALRALPPLLKGYLRVGCYVGDGAVIDHQFGTTDVLIVLPVSNINQRYRNYYGNIPDRSA